MDNFTAKPPAETRRGGFAMKITPALIVILLFGTAAEIACAKIWARARRGLGGSRRDLRRRIGRAHG